jgi:hypothetical protein
LAPSWFEKTLNDGNAALPHFLPVFFFFQLAEGLTFLTLFHFGTVLEQLQSLLTAAH